MEGFALKSRLGPQAAAVWLIVLMLMASAAPVLVSAQSGQQAIPGNMRVEEAKSKLILLKELIGRLIRSMPRERIPEELASSANNITSLSIGDIQRMSPEEVSRLLSKASDTYSRLVKKYVEIAVATGVSRILEKNIVVEVVHKLNKTAVEAGDEELASIIHNITKEVERGNASINIIIKIEMHVKIKRAKEFSRALGRAAIHEFEGVERARGVERAIEAINETIARLQRTIQVLQRVREQLMASNASEKAISAIERAIANLEGTISTLNRTISILQSYAGAGVRGEHIPGKALRRGLNKSIEDLLGDVAELNATIERLWTKAEERNASKALELLSDAKGNLSTAMDRALRALEALKAGNRTAALEYYAEAISYYKEAKRLANKAKEMLEEILGEEERVADVLDEISDLLKDVEELLDKAAALRDKAAEANATEALEIIGNATDLLGQARARLDEIKAMLGNGSITPEKAYMELDSIEKLVRKAEDLLDHAEDVIEAYKEAMREVGEKISELAKRASDLREKLAELRRKAMRERNTEALSVIEEAQQKLTGCITLIGNAQRALAEGDYQKAQELVDQIESILGEVEDLISQASELLD